METLGTILTVIGYIVMAAGGIWILVLAFQDSVMWGLGCLRIPIVQLIFAFTHWEDSKIPFLIQVGGAVIYFGGVFLGAAAG